LNRRWLYIVVGVLLMGVVATAALTAPQGTAPVGDQVPPTRAAREERAIQEARRQQLAEKEAALAARRRSLKNWRQKLTPS